jgi:FkbM family methyltransferase
MLIAIEPDPVNVQLCRRNLAQFEPRATVLQAALTPVPARVSLAPEFQGSWAAHIVSDSSGEIEGVDIKSLQERFRLLAVDLLKIDIEGSELPLFEHSISDWIENIGALMVELESFPSEAAFYSALDSRAFRFMRSGEITAAIRPAWRTSDSNGSIHCSSR